MQSLMISTMQGQRRSSRLMRQAAPRFVGMKNIISSPQQQQQQQQQTIILPTQAKNQKRLTSLLPAIGSSNSRAIAANITNSAKCPFPKTNFGSVPLSNCLSNELEMIPSSLNPSNQIDELDYYCLHNMDKDIDCFEDEDNFNMNQLNNCNHILNINNYKSLTYPINIGHSRSLELPQLSASLPRNNQLDNQVITFKIISNWVSPKCNNENNNKTYEINDEEEEDESSIIEISSINILDNKENPLDIFLVTTTPKIDDQDLLKEITNPNHSEEYDADTKRGDIALSLNTGAPLQCQEFTFFLMVQSSPEPHFLRIANGFSKMAIKEFEVLEDGKKICFGTLEINETRQICIAPFELHVSKSLNLEKNAKHSLNNTWSSVLPQIDELSNENQSPLSNQQPSGIVGINGDIDLKNLRTSPQSDNEQKTKYLEIVIDDTFCEENEFIGLNAIDIYDNNNLLIDNLRIENISVQGCDVVTNKNLLLKRSKEVDEWQSMFLAQRKAGHHECVKIRFEFKDPELVARVIFWNFNTNGGKPIDFGVRNCRIMTSLKEECAWGGVLNPGTGSKNSVAQTRTDIWLIERKLFF